MTEWKHLKIFARYLRNGSPIDEKSRPSRQPDTAARLFRERNGGPEIRRIPSRGRTRRRGAHDRDWETSRGRASVRHPSLDGFDPSKDVPSFVTPPRVPCRLPSVVVLTARSRIRPPRGEGMPGCPRARGDGVLPSQVHHPSTRDRSPLTLDPRVRRVRRVPVLDEKRIHASGAVSAPSRAPRGEHASFCEHAHVTGGRNSMTRRAVAGRAAAPAPPDPRRMPNLRRATGYRRSKISGSVILVFVM